MSQFITIGVRAGGARGAAAPPKFEQLRFFGQQEKIWANLLLKDVSMFFIIIIILKRQIFPILTRSRRNNSVTFTRDSGCLARDEFLVISEGYHMLIFFIVGHCTSLHQLEQAISSRELIRINFRVTFQNHLRSQNSLWQISSAMGLKLK